MPLKISKSNIKKHTHRADRSKKYCTVSPFVTLAHGISEKSFGGMLPILETDLLNDFYAQLNNSPHRSGYFDY